MCKCQEARAERGRVAWRSRTLQLLAASMALAALAPLPASASLFGEENATLGAILGEDIAQLAEMVKTVQGIITQIEQLKALVAQSKTVLKQIGTGNLNGLVGMLQTASRTSYALDRDIKFIGYKLSDVDRQREAIYQESLRGSDPSQFRAKSLQWNGALMESSRVAMRAQTNVSELDGRSQTLATVLSDSQAAEGVVGQLQLVIRALAVLHADLEGVQRSLDTGMRVTANVAAGQAAAGGMIEEQHVLSMDNYTNPGPSVAVPSQLPRFQ
jgi:P-type conjugative transfer protein TrbJ